MGMALQVRRLKGGFSHHGDVNLVADRVNQSAPIFINRIVYTGPARSVYG
jgi:hypothetical protein